MPEVRGEEERDSAFRVQLGEWLWQRVILQGVRRVHRRRGRLLRRRMWLQLRLRVLSHRALLARRRDHARRTSSAHRRLNDAS